jgi:hypothetical protein
MTDASPTPPADLPDGVVEALDARSPAELEAIARYADALAQHRKQVGANEHQDDATDAAGEATDHGDDSSERPDDAPDEVPTGVPSKATITVKEINDNRYYYWQWREGDEIKSQYEGPVTSSE